MRHTVDLDSEVMSYDGSDVHDEGGRRILFVTEQNSVEEGQ